jgi:hypothetical protein
MTKTGQGGGIEGRNVVHTKAPKSEPISHSISPGAVSRLGAKVGEGTPYKPLYSGPGYSPPVGPTEAAAGPRRWPHSLSLATVSDTEGRTKWLTNGNAT